MCFHKLVQFWIIFVNPFVYDHHLHVHSIRVSACFGSSLPCHWYSMNCSAEGKIQLNRMQYGLYGSRKNACSETCERVNSSCCAYLPSDCLEDFNEYHAVLLTNRCSGLPSCEKIQAVQSNLKNTNECSANPSQYVIIDYSCVLDKFEDVNSLPEIIGAVIAAIIVIAVVIVALIIFKRRRKKHTTDDSHISELPVGMTNHANESSNEVTESPNYEIINDESVLTYYMPNKNIKGTASIPGKPHIYGTVSAEEYDKIEFEMKGAINASNYDKLPSVEGKIRDKTYSHVSNELRAVTTARDTANEYSHFKLNNEDTLTKGDNYSHVDLEGNCKKHPESNTNEENDSYNHVDFGDTKHPMRNGEAVIGKNEINQRKSPQHAQM